MKKHLQIISVIILVICCLTYSLSMYSVIADCEVSVEEWEFSKNWWKEKEKETKEHLEKIKDDRLQQ